MQIINKPSLRQRTSIRLGGEAVEEILFENEHDEEEIIKHVESMGLPVYCLGGGSNIIVQEGLLDIILIKTMYRSEIKTEDKGEYLYVKAPLSIPLPLFINKMNALGAEGFSTLVGVPGTLGGAIMMNAGSYGRESTKYLSSLRVLSLKDGFHTYTDSDWETSYRTFSLQESVYPFLAIEAEFFFPKQESSVLKEISYNLMKKKKATQPVSAYSAGCVFKNPEMIEISAGKMLENVGMKKEKRGAMYFSELHANFLLNSGNGTTQDALELLELGREKVHQEYGCLLEYEVRFW
ncbi:MAG: UDP-N-acetylmuramate dehydrogenase [Desulfovibrionaceae bacterium]